VPLVIAIALAGVSGCGDSSERGVFIGAGGSFGSSGGAGGGFVPPKAGCPPASDQDGDGLPDMIEGPLDNDGDGLPSFTDPDSDDDGVLDFDEVDRTLGCAARRDCDNDGAPDTEDTDSDNDLVLDAIEVSSGLSACIRDSDGDGCEDLADFELGGCDASRVIAKFCNDGPVPGEPIVRFKLTSAAERLEPNLEIVKLVNNFDPTWLEGARPTEISPSGAGTIEAGGFSNVSSDATLGIAVSFAFTPVQSFKSPWALIAVRVYTPSRTLAGEGLLIVTIGDCGRPIPI
jgi:hypothetical protein